MVELTIIRESEKSGDLPLPVIPKKRGHAWERGKYAYVFTYTSYSLFIP